MLTGSAPGHRGLAAALPSSDGSAGGGEQLGETDEGGKQLGETPTVMISMRLIGAEDRRGGLVLGWESSFYSEILT